MFAYLGIVLDSNVKKGHFVPSYILIERKAYTNDCKSGFGIKLVDKDPDLIGNKIIFRKMYDNDEIIDYMSRNIINIKIKDKLYRRTIRGLLCYFECDKKGRRNKTENKEYLVMPIKHVPDPKIGNTSRNTGWKRMKERLQKRVILKSNIFTVDPQLYTIAESEIKPILYNKSKGRKK